MDRSNLIAMLARQALGWSEDATTTSHIADLEAGRGSPVARNRWDAAKAGVRTAVRFFGDERLSHVKVEVEGVPNLGTQD